MPHRTDSVIPESYRFGHRKQDVEIPLTVSEIETANTYNKKNLNKKTFGLSDTNVKTFDTSLGALAPFLNQASGVMNQIFGAESKELSQKDKDINMGRIALQFFTQMGASASQPGQTALGAANIAGANVAQSYLAKVQSDKDREAKLEQDKKSGALSLAMQLKSAEDAKTIALAKATNVKPSKPSPYKITNQADVLATMRELKMSLINPDTKQFWDSGDIIPLTAAQYDKFGLGTLSIYKDVKEDSKIYTNMSEKAIVVNDITIQPNNSARLKISAVNSVDAKIGGNLVEVKKASPTQKDRDRSDLYRLGAMYAADKNSLSQPEFNLYTQLFQIAEKGRPVTRLNPENNMMETFFEGGLDLSSMKLLPRPEGLAKEDILSKKFQTFNADQTNSAGFAIRMINTDGIVRDILQDGYKVNLKDMLAQHSWFTSKTGNSMTSLPGQRFYTATTNFINAQLRKESGAAIGPVEYEDALKTYFPMMGDSAQLIEDKRDSRQALMRIMAGNGQGPIAAHFKELVPFLTTTIDDKKVNIIRSQEYNKAMEVRKDQSKGIIYGSKIANKTIKELENMLQDPDVQLKLADYQIRAISSLLRNKKNNQNSSGGL